MADTSIEWTDATWNPVAGCAVISPGCTNCYAMRMAARLDAMGMKKYRGLTRKSGKRAVWTGKVRLDDDALGIPASWKKPRRIFVNSMSDLAVPAKFVAAVWDACKGAYRVLRLVGCPAEHISSYGVSLCAGGGSRRQLLPNSGILSLSHLSLVAWRNSPVSACAIRPNFTMLANW